MALTPSLAGRTLLALLFSVTMLSQAPSSGSPATVSAPIRVRTDIASFHLDHHAIGAAPTQSGSSRDDKNTLSLCAPNEGLASSTKPFFFWHPPAQGSPYVRLTVLDDDEQVIFQREVIGTSYVYPDQAPPLSAGRSYFWSVSGNGSGERPASVKFQVQDQSQRDRTLKELAAASSADDPLVRAQVLLRNSVWYDAVSALRSGLQQMPDRKDIKTQLNLLLHEIAPGCAKD